MKAFVLSSGGVDSTTCVAVAISIHGVGNVSTLSFFYNQRHDKELQCADAVATYYGIPNYRLNIADIFKGSDCALLQTSNQEVGHGEYVDQIRAAKNGIVSTYVPFRNGLMLAAATSYVMSLCPNEDICLYIGAHADDAAGNAYADCREDFLSHMDSAVQIGTYGRVRLVFPLATYTKAEVVKTGLKLRAPYQLTWSCYEGGDKPCGKCGTCIDRAKAFAANNAEDPALKGV